MQVVRGPLVRRWLRRSGTPALPASGCRGVLWRGWSLMLCRYRSDSWLRSFWWPSSSKDSWMRSDSWQRAVRWSLPETCMYSRGWCGSSLMLLWTGTGACGSKASMSSHLQRVDIH